MEGYGFSIAVLHTFDRPRHLVIRALCDYANGEKGDRWHTYAAAAAASYAHHLLADWPFPPVKSTAVNMPQVGDMSMPGERSGYREHFDYYDVPGAATVSAVTSIAPPLGRRDPRLPLRGRDGLFDELVDALSKRRPEPQVRILHGLVGCGKTRIALELAQWAAENEVDSWWISAAEGSANLVAGMLTVARLLGATDEHLKQGDPADVLWRRLNEYEQRWLLVVDNADDLDILTVGSRPLADGTGWLRPFRSDKGLVVATSREGNHDAWGHWTKLHSVGTLTPAEGAEMLADLAPDAGPLEAARLLSARLGGLPLALRLAGSYLSKTTTEALPWAGDSATINTYSAYHEAVDQRNEELFHGTGEFASVVDGSWKAILTAWDLSLRLLDQRGVAHARALLRLMSCFGHAPIPYVLMLQPERLAESPLFAQISGRTLWETLQALAGVGLVDLQRDRTVADLAVARLAVIHPLVRDASRASPEVADHVDEYLRLVTRLLQRATDDLDPVDPSTWPSWQILFPHCPSAMELLTRSTAQRSKIEIVDITGLRYRGARYLQATGLFHQAEAEYRTIVEVRERRLNSDDPETLGARHSLSVIFWYLGQLEQADHMLRLLVADATKSLGSDDPETLEARHDLAVVLRARAKLEDAELILREVHGARVRVLGQNHPDTLSTEHEIGFVRQDRGDHEEADRIYRQVLQKRQEQFGLDDEAKLMYLKHSIAYVVQMRGCYREADALFREVLSSSNRLLGPGHPHTLAVRNNLGLLLRQMHCLDEAQRTLDEVLVAREKVLGPDHPDTLTTRYNLGLTWYDRQDQLAAERIFQQVLGARERVLGSDHPDTLETRFRLGVLLRDIGKDAEAQLAFGEVSKARQRVLGPTHPDTQAALKALDDVAGG